MSSDLQRGGAAMVVQVRFAAVAAATTWIAMWSWRGFTERPADFLAALVVVGAVVAITGGLARWRRLPGGVVVLAQLVVGGAATCQVVADRPWPGAEFWAALQRAGDAATTYASPVPDDGLVTVQPLLVVGGFLAMVLVDLCAATLRRVPLAGLPLLTVYSVPISLIDRGLSWWVFAITAIGFLALLYLQEEEHLSRWGRSLDGSTSVRRLSDTVRGSAVGVGAAATAAAVALPLAIPTFDLAVFDVGPGRGGSGDIEVVNPLVDMRRDLERGEDIDMITVTTDDPDPDHLRIAVLKRFTNDQWSGGNRRVPEANLADGRVPAPDSDPEVVRYDEADYEVQVAEEFQSRWLPTQAPITSIYAEGDWRYAEDSIDFLAGNDDLTTAGLSYSMTAALPDYDQDALLALNTSPVTQDDELTDLPADLPDEVRDLAREETSEAGTDFERAVLLSQFFRETGGFVYDDQVPDDPVGSSELTDFLFTPPEEGGRRGYCEQYAAAMGVMARTLGIPARVAVGFLNPSAVFGEPGTWVYSAHDLHAWVELYFPGAGWVLFDPTPSAASVDVLPSYSNATVEEEVETATSAAPSSSAPAPTRPERTDDVTSSAPTPEEQAGGNGSDGASFPWAVVAGVAGGLLLLVLLALLPSTLRRRQRERRLGGGPELAWEELRAVVVDLRGRWPEGRSPRETAIALSAAFGRVGSTDPRPAHGPDLAPEAVAALDVIVGALERLRYARDHSSGTGELRDQVEACTAALEAGASPRDRRRARWLPASVFERRRVEGGSASGRESELVGSSAEQL
ncbi:transglutaminaseTgpA domain-containing protein [Nocardioides sp. C4-1]|uniref:transglutaminase family protein n=1 Tax=Nocardioides sp. C4-1 TaxID=3151851 RepID=UPI003265E62E